MKMKITDVEAFNGWDAFWIDSIFIEQEIKRKDEKKDTILLMQIVDVVGG